uniref:Myticalin D1 n=1 Tax=Mytilus galloprovincialis TaxID=29158 RepID=A0A286RMV9_MYTGA|nr:myticalin D1 [Mytilus galloprovincialis]
MKGVLLLSTTIFFALCMMDGCEGWGRRWRIRIPSPPRLRPWPRPYPRPWPRSATINTDQKRAILNDDIQDEDIETVDSEDGHLDERYVDMNDEDVMDDIDERNVNDPEDGD